MKKNPPAPIVCALLTLFIIFSPTPSDAGRAAIPITTDRHVHLSESRETIVAAWNGTEEVLIITAEISSSRETKVVEFIPLPARPTVGEIPPTVLDRIQKLILENAPKITTIEDGRKTTKSAVAGIDPISETRIGPHDITVVKIDNVGAFDQWIAEYMKREGIHDFVPNTWRHRAIVEDYLSRGITYFVFDEITVAEKESVVDPVMYRFEADSLYVPLVISSATPGAVRVDLFLIAPGTPKKWAIPSVFAPVAYKLPEGIDFGRHPELLKKYKPPTFSRDHPVSFPMSLTDRVSLSPFIAQIIPGWQTKVRLTGLRYEGSLSSLSSDITLSKGDFESTDFDTAGNAVGEAHEFQKDVPEGMVNLLVGPSAVPFVGGGTDAYTSRAAADGDPSTPYTLTLRGEWVVDLGDRREIEGVEVVAAVTKPDIVPSRNRLCLFTSDTGEFKGEQRRIDVCIVRSYTSIGGDDDPTRHSDRVVLTDRSLSTRWLKITYPYSESICDLYLFEVMIWGEKEE